MLSEDDMDILGKNMGDTLYFVDGYHGGVEGHMPDGAFEDILDALERLPEWKVSFEVEPESWNDLKRKDPTGYRRLKAFIKNEKTAGRIEFVSGAYGQPFCWAINGGKQYSPSAAWDRRNPKAFSECCDRYLCGAGAVLFVLYAADLQEARLRAHEPEKSDLVGRVYAENVRRDRPDGIPRRFCTARCAAL